MIEELQAAILKKDADGVVVALSQWNEEQRGAAIEPFNILMIALGFDDNVVLPCNLKPTDSEVMEKRKRDGIQQTSRRENNYDREMFRIARLGRFGILTLEWCIRFPGVPDYERQAAQIMADRSPPWWKEWYKAVTKDIEIRIEFWARLYERKMLSTNDFAPMASAFAEEIPEAFENSPEVIKKVLREIPECRDLVYQVVDLNNPLFTGSIWAPVIEWLCVENLLDKKRLQKVLIDTLHDTQHQTIRNGCLMIAKSIRADNETLAEFQPQWMGFLSDNQASVVGFAVEQLQKIEKAGLLNTHEAVTALPGIFGHKPKKHAKSAIELLARIAADEELRSEAVESTTTALMHPNKDIQSAALIVLEKYLRPDDSTAISAIEMNLETIAPTLKNKVTGLLKFEQKPVVEKSKGKTTAGKSKTKNSSKQADTSTNKEESAPLSFDVSEYANAAAMVPQHVRALLRIDESLEAARAGNVDLTCDWHIKDMPMLATAEPLSPIETVEELIDVTSAAVEQLECADTADRILSGIARLHRERPKSFESMTRSLATRVCVHILDRPQRGLVAGFLGTPFSLLIGAWLGIKANQDDYTYLTTPVQRYLIEVEQRVRSQTAYPLISEATHSGGWIDPCIWVARLATAHKEQIDVLETDLERSCLRLAPDGREEALKLAMNLQQPFKALAMAALGGDGAIDHTLSAPVWIAALRACDPWCDLSKQIEPDEQGMLTDEIAKQPDVIYPSNYEWNVEERLANTTMQQDLITAWPTQEASALTSQQVHQMELILEALQNPNDPSADLSKLISTEQKPEADSECLTAQLHSQKTSPAPAYSYPYLASLWPMKLDWYWCLSTKALSRRLESGPSVEEPYGYFLTPLFEHDRPLTTMSTRALWIASVSKDSNSRSMAIETWIALVDSDRIDTKTLVNTLAEVSTGGWVKLNRLGEILSEVAAVSPAHAWAVVSVLEAYLAVCDPLPRNATALLEPLDEYSEVLGRAISAEFKPRLQTIKGGKAKPLAKSLLNRPDSMTAARQTAIDSALNARIARASRVTD